MSPKSRGRKSKNKNKNKSGPRKANPRLPADDRGPLILDFRAGVDPASRVYDARDLVGDGPLGMGLDLGQIVATAGENVAFERVTERLLEESSGLLTATGPRQLEQATAELLAVELASPEMQGRRTDLLCRDLVEVGLDRVLSDIACSNDTWRGSWWLLHGLASIGSLGAGAYAAQAIADAQVPKDEPDWLGLLPGISLTGEAYELRDKWGLRIGVIAEFAYPGGVDPYVYLLDLDASWNPEVTAAGVFDDVAAAESAWRSSLPDGEAAGEAEPITPNALAGLYAIAHLEELMSHDELLTGHYRAERRISDILVKLGSRRATPSFELDPEEFTAWYRTRHGYEPEDDLAELLAEEWTLGILPGTAQLLSPGRATGFYDYSLHMVGVDEEDLQQMMPEWIRWVGEKVGADPEVIEASAAALQG